MELILLRHGKAEDHGHPGGDGARALVEKGRDQARRAACFLQAVDRLPDIVLTSPVRRARETAGLFCQSAAIDAPLLQPWLACGMRPEKAAVELSGFRECPRVMIVGHEPDFSFLVEWLLDTGAGGVDVKKGSLACIRCTPPSRGGQLMFLIPPAMLRSEMP